MPSGEDAFKLVLEKDVFDYGVFLYEFSTCQGFQNMKPKLNIICF